MKSGNLAVPLEQFIAQTSDPIYWSVIAAALLKTISSKLESEIDFKMTEQDKEVTQMKIKELGELSKDFIAKAYAVNQEKTIEFLKEGRIGGFSIIGKF